MEPGGYPNDESLVVRKQRVTLALSFFDGQREDAIMLIPSHDEHSMSLVRRVAYFFNEPTIRTRKQRRGPRIR